MRLAAYIRWEALRQAGAALLLAVAAAGCHSAHTGEYRPSKHALNLNNRAVRAFEEGDYEQALVLVNDALAAEPGFAQAYANKAAVLEKMGRNGEAVAVLESLLAIQPDYAEAYIPLGLLLERLGRASDAAERYRAALDVFGKRREEAPDDTVARLQQAIAQYLLNNKRVALQELRQLQASQPGNELAERVRRRIEQGDRDTFISGLSGGIGEPPEPGLSASGPQQRGPEKE